MEKVRLTRSSKAFTLVELLVVIAIIALLLSILMPSLQRAREVARQVVCGSRQRQVAISLMMYVQNYDGWIMPYSTEFVKGATSDQMKWKSPRDGAFYPNTDADEEYWYGILYASKGLDNRDVFFCPSTATPDNKTLRRAQASQGSTDIKNIEDFGMGWTVGLRDWADPIGDKWVNNRAPQKLDRMPRPSDFFLIADTVLYDQHRYRNTGSKYGQFFVTYDRGRAGSNGWVTGVHLRHGGKAVAVFADGHVEFKAMQYWIDLQDLSNWQQKYCLGEQGYLVFDQQMQEWMRDNATGMPKKGKKY